MVKNTLLPESNEASMKLRAYLRDARTRRGLSQATLAEILGYESAQYISDWERGVSVPPMKKLVKIVNVLEIDLEELFVLLMDVATERVIVDLTQEFSKIRKRAKR